jgi:ferredoxin
LERARSSPCASLGLDPRAVAWVRQRAPCADDGGGGAARSEGYANCLSAAPGLFTLNDHDIAEPVPPEQPESDRATLEDAARRCPTGAITLTDA